MKCLPNILRNAGFSKLIRLKRMQRDGVKAAGVTYMLAYTCLRGKSILLKLLVRKDFLIVQNIEMKRDNLLSETTVLFN